MRSKPARRVIGFALILFASLAAAGWYTLSTLDSGNDAPITVDESELSDLRVMAYTGSEMPTGDDPGSEFVDLIEILGKECDKIDEEIATAAEMARQQNRTLDLALDEANPSLLMQDTGDKIDLDGTSVGDVIVSEIRTAFQTSRRISPSSKTKHAAALDSISNDYVLQRTPSGQNLIALRELAAESSNEEVLALLSLCDLEISAGDRHQIWQELLQDSTALSPLLQFEVARHYQDYTEQMGSIDVARSKLATFDAWFSCCKHHRDDPNVLRFLAAQLEELVEESNTFLRGDMFQRAIDLPDAEFPDWMKHYFAYRLARSLAAKHRGETVFSQVASSDAEHFIQYSEIAGTHLMKAWVLHPRNPDLVCDLLSHETWSGATALSSLQWFCLSLALDPLVTRAYAIYAQALQPKWGGSRRQQVEMTWQCLNSGAAGSRVRLFAGYFITSIAGLRGYQLTINDPELNKLAVEFAALVSMMSSDEVTGSVYYTHLPAIGRILHDHGEYEMLGKLLLAAPGGLNSFEFEQRYLSLPLLRSLVSLDAGEQKLRLWHHLYQSLVSNAHTLSPQEVAECREQVDSMSELDQGETKLAFQTFTKIAVALDRFHGGKEVHLAYEGNEHLWLNLSLPVYAVEGGVGYELSVNDNFGHLMSLIRFPVPFKVEATLTSHQNVADPFGAALFVGPRQHPAYFSRQANGAVVRFCREDRDVPANALLLFDRMPDNAYGTHGQHFRAFSMGDHMSLRCRLEVREDRIDAFSGDRRLSGASTREQISIHGIIQLGRLCNTTTYLRGHRSAHSITDITVLKLDPRSNRESE